jgi:hypothetical protein
MNSAGVTPGRTSVPRLDRPTERVMGRHPGFGGVHQVDVRLYAGAGKRLLQPLDVLLIIGRELGLQQANDSIVRLGSCRHRAPSIGGTLSDERRMV